MAEICSWVMASGVQMSPQSSMQYSPVAFATCTSYQWTPSSQSQPQSQSTSLPTRKIQEARAARLTVSSRSPSSISPPTKRIQEAQAARLTASSLERLLLAITWPTNSFLLVSLNNQFYQSPTDNYPQSLYRHLNHSALARTWDRFLTN